MGCPETIEYRKYADLSTEERDEFQFSVAEFVVILSFIFSGTLLGAILDQLGILGFLPEGVVRALAGTADTLGFAFLGLYAFWKFQRNPDKDTVVLNVFGLTRKYTRQSMNEYRDWVRGGLIGLGIAFVLQGLVFGISSDPHGLVGVIYAFGFSNIDNFMGGLVVLIATIRCCGCNNGLRRYWTHPFYFGNAIMVIGIPIVTLIIRYLTGFRPDLNIHAGIESGLMDVDSIGAFLIFLLVTRVLRGGVPNLCS